MKSFIVFFVLCFSITIPLFAQVKIPYTTVSFQFPSSDWRYYETIQDEDDSMIYLYAFNKISVDSTEIACNPILRIKVKPDVLESGMEFSLAEFIKTPSVVLESYENADFFPNKNSAAYLAEYVDTKGETLKLFILDFVNKKQGIEFKFITSLDCYDEFQEEFIKICKTINLKSK